MLYFFIFYFFIFFSALSNKINSDSYLFFTFDHYDFFSDDFRDISTVKKNVYSSNFYLSNQVRINTTFMLGTSQKILYLNYPTTFADESQNLEYKNLNSAGIIILCNQPKGVTASNLSAQKQILPYAYFTTQDNSLGWSLYSPADYYQESEKATSIYLYNSNILIGKDAGFFNSQVLKPYEVVTSLSIKKRIDSTGAHNISLGNNSSQYESSKNTNFNTVTGDFSGNNISGSYNSIYGSRNGLTYNTYSFKSGDMIKDYYAYNSLFNYNNIFGYLSACFHKHNLIGGSMIMKQNNLFGNINFMSPIRAYRNCVFGNLILSSYDINNYNQFDWVDSNILIGNEIFYKYDANMISGLYGNIILIPNGGLEIYGGLGLSSAMNPLNSNNVQCNGSIMIGSCGSSVPYDRSYKTFIANIYQSSLLHNGIPISKVDQSNIEAKVGFIGETNFPAVVMINTNDQLGQMQVVPYGNVDSVEKNDDYKKEPGNVMNIDSIVTNFLFSPEFVPVIGVALENSESSTHNGLLYTIDSYSLVQNSFSSNYNPLSIFITYAAIKEKLPYQSLTTSTNNIYNAIVGETSIAGYEHYYLIPLVVRGCQILYKLIQQLTDRVNAISENYLEKKRSNELEDLNKKLAKIELLQGFLVNYILADDNTKEDIKKKLLQLV